ncbi:hypothetical protein AB0A74_20355 [Saccharothrix sp. NPDC042600]|uniref:hypothetical protein n=1 Tax=Saccharothrix TaxID=2071 RepID=UPI0034031688|nr:hypothetical protein GCM10017745_74960 [Saccharothrix mutabilis subsp. capreolus]
MLHEAQLVATALNAAAAADLAVVAEVEVRGDALGDSRLADVWVEVEGVPAMSFSVAAGHPVARVTCDEYVFEGVRLDEVQEFARSLWSGRAEVRVSGRRWRWSWLRIDGGWEAGRRFRDDWEPWEGRLAGGR